MRRLWFCFLLRLLQAGLAQVLPPHRVLLQDQQLTWSPATQDQDVTYTVYLYRPSLQQWEEFPACRSTSSRVCDVASSREGAEPGCVLLRVRAERGGLSSPPADACSPHGSHCTPEVRLSSRSGFLHVHLSGDHSLAQEYAAHASHRIYLGREGEALQEHTDTASSLSLPGLQAGVRYCVRVQYVVFSRPAGASSCELCEEVLQEGSGRTVPMVLGVLLVLLLVVVVPVVSYLLIFHRKTLKRLLQPPCTIPLSFGESLRQQPLLSLQPADEVFQQVCVCPPEDRG